MDEAKINQFIGPSLLIRRRRRRCCRRPHRRSCDRSLPWPYLPLGRGFPTRSLVKTRGVRKGGARHR